ncbi:11451_t:CDS:2 [Funneliformis caledonium]|uniref:11451_t:CDS:1 n=1 Tax=Funneliformis caledonium TaxID=1117310 RepID=A0A9N9I0N0_9GLOM|nr:11451_t:CDS:2 [Funneliformis caledonium]
MRLFFVVLAKPLGQSSAVHITEENNTIGKLIWKELYGGEVGSNRVNQWTLWKVKDLIEGDEKWKALEDIEDSNTETFIKNELKGGLGGTNMKRKEDGLCYEGLDLTHIECQRKPTIKRLLDDLFEKRIILIRSPPMAGKTSLSQLLEYNILQSDEAKKGSRCVFHISLLWMVKYVDEWTFAEGFKTLMNMKWDEFIQLCKHSDIEIFQRSSELEFGDVFAYLKTYDFYSHLKEIRATPRVNDIIPHNGRIIKTNVLVDIGRKVGCSTLDFPAPLLRAMYLQDRFSYVIRSELPPKSFKEFIKSVYAIMNPKVLQNSKGKGKDGRLFERVWQMEFYRASLQVLPEDIYPSVDVGKAFGSKGYVDFYVNDKCNWAIELLRWSKWAIIDIRDGNMKASESEKRERNDIYVICAENFETVQLVYPNGDEEDIWLLGKENLLGYDSSEFLDDQDDQMEIMEIDY